MVRGLEGWCFLRSLCGTKAELRVSWHGESNTYFRHFEEGSRVLERIGLNDITRALSSLTMRCTCTLADVTVLAFATTAP